MEPILKAKGLVKRFGRVVALDNCDFELLPGEILLSVLCLNTLIHMLGIVLDMASRDLKSY